MSFFSIVSNINNGAGLQKDYELLRRTLESAGHRVHGESHVCGSPTLYKCDVVIFLEVIDHRWFGRAKEYWFVPNSEWWYDQWNQFLPHINLVLCKTKDALEIWKRKVDPSCCVHVGWEAPDFYRPEVPRIPAFLHLAGKSNTKNTMPIIGAWKQYSIPYPLTITMANVQIAAACENIPNVTLHHRITDEQAVSALNSHRFFLMPSQYEGYGMGLHEAQGCGSIIITTGAPPMNEMLGIAPELLVPVETVKPHQAARLNYINPASVFEIVRRATLMNLARLESISKSTRDGFLLERDFFRESFAEVLARP